MCQTHFKDLAVNVVQNHSIFVKITGSKIQKYCQYFVRGIKQQEFVLRNCDKQRPTFIG